MFNQNLCTDFYNKIDQYFSNNFMDTMNPAHIEIEIKLRNILMNDNLDKEIKNFRNNEISNLLGSIEYPDKKLYFTSANNNKKNKLLVNLGFVKDLYIKKRKIIQNCKKLNIDFCNTNENNIGNPTIYNFFGFKETGTNIHNNLYFSVIKKIIKKYQVEHILEIGSGFGKLCSLIKDNFSKVSYNIVELPGSSLICLYYLENYFRGKYDVCYNLDEKKEIECDIQKINIIPFNNLLKNKLKLPKKTIIINTQSFQHMNKKTILLYLELFKDNNIQNIISLNRDIPHPAIEDELIFEINDEVDYKKIFNDNNYKIDDEVLIDSINDHFFLHTFKYT